MYVCMYVCIYVLIYIYIYMPHYLALLLTHFVISSYRDRFWKKEYFEGLELVRKAVRETYGDSVSTSDAALRWMLYHSRMDGSKGGEDLPSQWRKLYLYSIFSSLHFF